MRGCRIHLLLLFTLIAQNLGGWQESYASGLWDDSYRIAEEALISDSSSSRAWAALSLSASALNRFTEAEELALNSIAIDSTSAMAWAALGMARADSAGLCMDLFEKALQLAPDFIPAIVGYSRCLMLEEEYEDAAAALSRAMNIDPSWINVWIQSAEVYTNQSEFQRAEMRLAEAMKRWPDNRRLMSEMAWLKELQGEYGAAEDLYRDIGRLYPEDTDCLIDLGMLLESQGKYGQAVKVYRELSERDPESYWAWGEIGICLQQLGNSEAARGSYLSGLNINPDYSFAQYRLGLMAEQQGYYSEAAEWYSECVDSDPGFVEAWVSLGLMCEETGDYSCAEAAYRKTVELDPDYSWAWGELGAVMEYMGEYDEAAEAYEQGIEVDSSYSWAWEQRGLLFEDEDDLESAAQWYRKAVDTLEDPGVWLMGELGFVHQRMENPDSAMKYYANAVSIDSSYTFGLQRLAPLFFRNGDAETALELWESYVDAGGHESTALCERLIIYESIGREDMADSLSSYLQTEYPFAWIDLAWTYSIAEPEVALDLARRAEDSAEDDHREWIMIAELYSELNREEQADQCFIRAIQTDPDSIDVWLKYGYHLFDTDREREAAEKYRQALELDSLSFEALSGLGEALLFSGSPDEALPLFRRAQKYDSTSPWLYAYIGLAYEKMGDSKKAMENYFHALTISPGYDYAENRIRGVTDTGYDPDWNRRETGKFTLFLSADTRVDNGNVRERKYSLGLETGFEYDRMGSEVSLDADHSFIETSRDYENDLQWTMVTLRLEKAISDRFTVSASSSWDRQPGTVRPWQISSYISMDYSRWLNDWLWISPSAGMGLVNTHWASGLEDERTDKTTLYGSLSIWLSEDDLPLPSLWLWGNFYLPPGETEDLLTNALAEMTFEMWDPLSLTVGYSVGYTRTPAYEYWDKYDTEFYSELNLRIF